MQPVHGFVKFLLFLLVACVLTLSCPGKATGSESVTENAKQGFELHQQADNGQRAHCTANKSDPETIRERGQNVVPNSIHEDSSLFDAGFVWGVFVTVLLVVLIYAGMGKKAK